MQRPARVPSQPFLHPGMFVGRVIVDDGVDRLSCRYLGLDGVEEADELLVPVDWTCRSRRRRIRNQLKSHDLNLGKHAARPVTWKSDGQSGTRFSPLATGTLSRRP